MAEIDVVRVAEWENLSGCGMGSALEQEVFQRFTGARR